MTRSKGTLALSTIELPKPFLVQAILQISNMSLINDLAKNLLLFFCCSKFSGHKSFTGTVITWRFPSDAFPQLPTNCLSVLDHFVELALKGCFCQKKLALFCQADSQVIQQEIQQDYWISQLHQWFCNDKIAKFIQAQFQFSVYQFFIQRQLNPDSQYRKGKTNCLPKIAK